jgi:positive regulator of sigma E activity
MAGSSHTPHVFHDGMVIGIDRQKVRVKIISQSACADCHAKGVCTAADMEEKIIEAVPSPGQTLHIGDTVTIVMAEKLGWLSVFYGFFLPFLVMVTVLFTANAMGAGETLSALSGLASLFPYYLLLYVFRKKIEKDFIFKAEKKNKFKL